MVVFTILHGWAWLFSLMFVVTFHFSLLLFCFCTIAYWRCGHGVSFSYFILMHFSWTGCPGAGVDGIWGFVGWGSWVCMCISKVVRSWHFELIAEMWIILTFVLVSSIGLSKVLVGLHGLYGYCVERNQVRMIWNVHLALCSEFLLLPLLLWLIKPWLLALLFFITFLMSTELSVFFFLNCILSFRLLPTIFTSTRKPFFWPKLCWPV